MLVRHACVVLTDSHLLSPVDHRRVEPKTSGNVDGVGATRHSPLHAVGWLKLLLVELHACVLEPWVFGPQTSQRRVVSGRHHQRRST